MGFIETRYVMGVRCDKPSCIAAFCRDERPWFQGHRDYTKSVRPLVLPAAYPRRGPHEDAEDLPVTAKYTSVEVHKGGHYQVFGHVPYVDAVVEALRFWEAELVRAQATVTAIKRGDVRVYHQQGAVVARNRTPVAHPECDHDSASGGLVAPYVWTCDSCGWQWKDEHR